MSDSDNLPECSGCGNPLREDGYRDNYKRYVCTNGCDISLSRPIGDPRGDGLSMEDLQKISSFVSEDEDS